jgi:hypothetical protein
MWNLILKEVPGMGFRITQPGSSVTTSLINGESKPKHVLLEIKVVHGQNFEIYFFNK